MRCIDKTGHTFRGDEILLDVGCGDGGVARLLKARVGAVLAVDLDRSPHWQDQAGLSFRVADGEALPFPDDSFDVVHSKDALHHMAHPERALAEYRRVLRPGGTALIIEANRYCPSLYLQMTLLRGHQHFTRAHFHRLVRSVFPEARFGAFEAHYIPGVRRLLSVQHLLEETIERLAPLRPFLAYNFAVCRV